MRKVLAGLAAVLTLAACAKVTDRGAEQPMTTIRLASSAFTPAETALVTAYQAKYPGDRVDVLPINGPIQLQELLEQGKADVSQIYIADQFTPLLLPLDPYIQRSRFDLKPFGTGLERVRRDGGLYVLPAWLWPRVFVVNKDRFAAAGVPLPTKGWTWEQLRSAAARLTSGEGANRVWGFAPPYGSQALSNWVQQRTGSAVLSFADDQTLKEGLQFFGTMIRADRSMLPDNKAESGGQPAPHSDFLAGKAAMSIEDLQVLMSGRGATTPWQIVPFPARSGSPQVGDGQPTMYGIAANTTNPDATWRFLQFIAGPEGARVVAKLGMLPAYQTDDARRVWFDRQPPPPPGAEVLFNTQWSFPAHEAGFFSQYTETAKTRGQAVGRLVVQTMNAERSWEEAFAEFQQSTK